MNTRLKIALIFACILFAIGVLGSHSDGSIYPWLPVGAAFAAIAITAGGLMTSQISRVVPIAFVGLGLGYWVYVYLFPASMIAFDPDAHAVRTQIILNSGDIRGLIGQFYDVAPGFHLFGAVAAMLTDLPVNIAFVVFPIGIFLVLAAFAPLIARVYVAKWQSQVIAVALVALSSVGIQYTTGPIPMAFAAPLVVGALYSVVLTRRVQQWRAIVLFVLLLTTAMFVHKISVLVVFTSLVLVISFNVLRYVHSEWQSNGSMASITAISALLLGIQWTYLTAYAGSAVEQILGVFRFNSLLTSTGEYAAASAYIPSLPLRATALGHIALLFLVGAFSGLYFLMHESDRFEIRLMLGFALVTTLLAGPGVIISAAPGAQRVFLYGVAPVSGLVAAGIYTAGSKFPSSIATDNLSRQIIGGIVCLLLIANLGGAGASPDYRDGPRMYLTEQETTGKLFWQDYVDDIVQADAYQADETVDFISGIGDADNQRTVPNPRWRDGMYSRELLDGTLAEQGFEHVALRTNVRTYRLPGGRFTLDWDPQQVMDSSYNRVYANGGSVLYSNG